MQLLPAVHPTLHPRRPTILYNVCLGCNPQGPSSPQQDARNIRTDTFEALFFASTDETFPARGDIFESRPTVTL